MSRCDILVAVAIIVLLSAPVNAVIADSEGHGHTQCNGTLPAGTYHDVDIAANNACMISGATVSGSIRGDAGSNLTLFGSKVGGDVVLESPKFVHIGSRGFCGKGTANSIEGDIQVHGGAGLICIMGNSIGGGVDVEGMRGAGQLYMAKSSNNVSGDLEVSDNVLASAVLTANNVQGDLRITGNGLTSGVFADNQVAGTLEFGDNTGSSDLTSNTITNDLTCNHNSPAPTGSMNTASKAAGQCVGMTTPAPTTATVTCNPSSVKAKHQTQCKAVVSSTAAGPTGTVAFSDDGTGKFGKVNCNGSHGDGEGHGGDSLTCTVSYTQSTAGNQTITASYGGDTYHDVSSGTFSLTIT